MIDMIQVANTVLDYKQKGQRLLEQEIIKLQVSLNDASLSDLEKMFKIEEATHRIKIIKTRLSFVIEILDAAGNQKA